jgi:hypothetical protein
MCSSRFLHIGTELEPAGDLNSNMASTHHQAQGHRNIDSAPAGAYPAVRACPGPDHPAGLSPIRATDQVRPPGLDNGMPQGRRPRALAPRPAALRRQEPRARRCIPVRRDETHRTQDRERIPALCDRRRERSSRGQDQARDAPGWGAFGARCQRLSVREDTVRREVPPPVGHSWKGLVGGR